MAYFSCSYSNSTLSRYMERHKVRHDGKAFQLVTISAFSLRHYLFMVIFASGTDTHYRIIK